MLNIKSKAFKFLVGTLAVVAFSYASAAMDFGTTTLRVGSKGEAVKAVQTCVGATADGSYGPMTKAKVMAWQATMGLTADGVFGAKSKAAAANGCGTTPAPVSQGNCPAGYVAVVPVAPTWAACAMSTTVSTGTNGYLTDIATDSTNRVSTVYESEQDKVVGGMRVTARLADQTVSRVRVTFKNTGTGSANLSKYISGATLWMDSTKLATMSVAQADRAISDDTYTFNFSGLNAVVKKDMIGRFYVSVNANGSLDTNDTGAGSNFTVKFVASGVNASSPDGTYDTYPSADQTFTGLSFGKFAANGVKAEINLSGSNPASTVVTVQNTAATNAITLLKFTVKATNSNLTLRKVPIQIVATGTTTPATTLSSMINTVKLYNGSTLIDSVDGSAALLLTGGTTINTAGTACASLSCGYLFTNLSNPGNVINSGTTSEFSVVVDLKQVTGNYVEGNTLTASLTNADALLTTNLSVLDSNGDQLTAGSTYRIGSAIGNVMTTRVNGVNVVQGTPTITQVTDNAGIITAVTYNIPLTVTAFGQTLYTGQAAELAAAASGTGASAKAFSFALQEAAAPATDLVAAPTATAVTSTLSSSDATIEGSGFRLDSGTAKHFTMQVIVSCTAASCTGATTGNYRVHSVTVRTATDSALTAPTNQTLLPNQSYQTGFNKIK